MSSFRGISCLSISTPTSAIHDLYSVRRFSNPSTIKSLNLLEFSLSLSINCIFSFFKVSICLCDSNNCLSKLVTFMCSSSFFWASSLFCALYCLFISSNSASLCIVESTSCILFIVELGSRVLNAFAVVLSVALFVETCGLKPLKWRGSRVVVVIAAFTIFL